MIVIWNMLERNKIIAFCAKSKYDKYRMKQTLLEKYNLKNWFEETFTEQEKEILISAYSDFNNEDAVFNSSSAAYFLAFTLPWYKRKRNGKISMKVAKKVIELINEEKTFQVLDLHFIYLHLIETFYLNRDLPNAFHLAILMCNKQIEIAPQAAKAFATDPLRGGDFMPCHKGYEQLAIIEKKKKNWKRVIELCEQAKMQGWGFTSDWDKRIAEAKKHIEWQN